MQTVRTDLKAYSSASNAKRGASSAVAKLHIDTFVTGVKTVKFTTTEGVDAFGAEVYLDHIPGELPDTELEILKDFALVYEGKAAEPVVDEMEKAAERASAPKGPMLHKSAVEKPVAAVHRICGELFDAAAAEGKPRPARKDVIAACVSQGIATHTAATQYARWREKNLNA